MPLGPRVLGGSWFTYFSEDRLAVSASPFPSLALCPFLAFLSMFWYAILRYVALCAFQPTVVV